MNVWKVKFVQVETVLGDADNEPYELADELHISAETGEDAIEAMREHVLSKVSHFEEDEESEAMATKTLSVRLMDLELICPLDIVTPTERRDGK